MRANLFIQFAVIVLIILQINIYLSKASSDDEATESEDTTAAPPYTISSDGYAKMPCDLSTDPNCVLKWAYDPTSDLVKFQLNYINAEDYTWYAIGFNTKRQMVNSIVLFFQFTPDRVDSYFGKLKDYVPPTNYSIINNIKMSSQNGVTSLSFSIPSKVAVGSTNLDFSGPYLVAVGTGAVSRSSLVPKSHDHTPAYTYDTIDFKATVLSSGTTASSSTTRSSSTPFTFPSPITLPPLTLPSFTTPAPLFTTTPAPTPDGSEYCTNIDSYCKLSWNYVASSDILRLTFRIKPPKGDGWYSIGFNEDANMIKTHAIMIVMNGGSYNFYTGYIDSRAAPTKDSTKYVSNYKVNLGSDYITLTFDVKPIVTHDNKKVLDFTDCYKIVFGAGSIDRDTGSILKHYYTPEFTSSCYKLITAAPTTSSIPPTTTVAPTTTTPIPTTTTRLTTTPIPTTTTRLSTTPIPTTTIAVVPTTGSTLQTQKFRSVMRVLYHWDDNYNDLNSPVSVLLKKDLLDYVSSSLSSFQTSGLKLVINSFTQGSVIADYTIEYSAPASVVNQPNIGDKIVAALKNGNQDILPVDASYVTVTVQNNDQTSSTPVATTTIPPTTSTVKTTTLIPTTQSIAIQTTVPISLPVATTPAFTNDPIYCSSIDSSCRLDYIQIANFVQFKLTIKPPTVDTWYAIGFNNARKMPGTSTIIIKWEKSTYTVSTSYIGSYAPPKMDTTKNINTLSVYLLGSTIALAFMAPQTIIHDNNVVLSLANCYPIVITSGTIVNGVINQHSKTPIYSQNCYTLFSPTTASSTLSSTTISTSPITTKSTTTIAPNTAVSTSANTPMLLCKNIDPICSLSWVYNSSSKFVTFELNIQTPNSDSWYAIGFNKAKTMVGTSAIIFVYRGSSWEHIPHAKSAPQADTTVSIKGFSYSVVNSQTRLLVTVPAAITNSNSNILTLSDCYPIVIANGPSVSGKLFQHVVTPVYSDKCYNVITSTVASSTTPLPTAVPITTQSSTTKAASTSATTTAIKPTDLFTTLPCQIDSDPLCKIGWYYNQTSNRVNFQLTISTPRQESWYAIGFNKNSQMIGSSVILVLFTSSRLTVTTGYIFAYLQPVVDINEENIGKLSGNLTNNQTVLSFDTNAIIRNDNNNHLNLSDTYLISVGTGTISGDTLNKHTNTPKYTNQLYRVAAPASVSTTTQIPTTVTYPMQTQLIQIVMRVLLNWNDNYNDLNSEDTQLLQQLLYGYVSKALSVSGLDSFQKLTLNALRKGSVIVDYTIDYTARSNVFTQSGLTDKIRSALLNGDQMLLPIDTSSISVAIGDNSLGNSNGTSDGTKRVKVETIVLPVVFGTLALVGLVVAGIYAYYLKRRINKYSISRTPGEESSKSYNLGYNDELDMKQRSSIQTEQQQHSPSTQTRHSEDVPLKSTDDVTVKVDKV